VPTPQEVIKQAFEKLKSRPGYVDRPDQLQLALILSDVIESGSTALIEAPTGLGKSLACLIPALAHAELGKRIVISTYTNVLAEQYWKKDLPLARSLIEDSHPAAQSFLVGRQRYTCLQALRQHKPEIIATLKKIADTGIESDFREACTRHGIAQKEATDLWKKVSVPPTCPAQQCPDFQDCFYYQARRKTTSTNLTITNHSVVMRNALMQGLHRVEIQGFEEADSGEDDPEHEYDFEDQAEVPQLLGKIDFLILDEAHDFPSAASSGLEYRLGPAQIEGLISTANRIEKSLASVAKEIGSEQLLLASCDAFRQALVNANLDLQKLDSIASSGWILETNPLEWADHSAIRERMNSGRVGEAKEVVNQIFRACSIFDIYLGKFLKEWQTNQLNLSVSTDKLTNEVRNYRRFIRDESVASLAVSKVAAGCVSYLGKSRDRDGKPFVYLQRDVVDLKLSLTSLIWEATPWACLSATLCVDQSFEFYTRITGAPASTHSEIMPSPFDFARQASLYIPPPGVIPDSGEARKLNTEANYYDALSSEIAKLIYAVGGKTLVLFHSRKEMEAVYQRMNLPNELPLFIQDRFSGSNVGDHFRTQINSSLFAVRSYWTGFDAPGETLSCLILVRIPFEIPTEPPQLARAAMLQAEGLNPFMDQSLPAAKMMLRQGAGRLIRSASDTGIIALMDSRVHTKRYGPEIIANMPVGIPVFDSLEKMASAGLLPGCLLESS